MKTLIDKYLDGELSEMEATALVESIARDPELDAELRAYENMLAAATDATTGEPSAGFSDVVMDRIAAARGPATRPSPRPGWRMALVWAAALFAVFIFGRMTVGDRSGTVAQSDAGTNTVTSPRAVRLVYVPRDPNVTEVTITGTFTGWDPAGIEMERNGSAWTAQLFLAPGTYEYMFVENGERWVTDPLALQTRDDGFGRENAVLDVSI